MSQDKVLSIQKQIWTGGQESRNINVFDGWHISHHLIRRNGQTFYDFRRYTSIMSKCQQVIYVRIYSMSRSNNRNKLQILKDWISRKENMYSFDVKGKRHRNATFRLLEDISLLSSAVTFISYYLPDVTLCAVGLSPTSVFNRF